MRLRLTALAGFYLFCLAGIAVAEPYPNHDDLYVNDFAEVIDEDTEQAVRSALETLNTETGIEMTVLTIRSRSDFDMAGSLEEFATGLFNSWGIGDADRNDGILLLVVPEDRETRIELGAAYNQGYDVLAQDIISRWLVPEFRDGRYSQGIDSGTQEIIARIAKRHSAQLPPEMLTDEPSSSGGQFGRWIAIAMFAGFAVFAAFRRKISDGIARFRKCPSCGQRGLHRHRDIRAEATPSSSGTGLLITRCRNCDYRDEREYRIGSRRSGTGSRGGFGGGRSSGGGASGRW